MGTGSSPVTINGNLCVDSAISQIEIGGSVGSGATYNQPFTVNGDVWVTHSRAFYAHNGDFSSNYNKLILGKILKSIFQTHTPPAIMTKCATTRRLLIVG